MSTMKTRKWFGTVGKLMQEHTALRESLGRRVEAETYILHQLNRFMYKHYPKLKTPNRYVILHFLNTKKHCSPWGRRNVVIHVRQFCRFLNQRGIPCYVPDKTLTPKLVYKPRYFPLIVDDVKRLMVEARKVRTRHPIMGQTYATIIGLLWSTGMRRGEVVRLNHSDVNFEKNTILIRESKNHKIRMIPIDKSVAEKLKEYVEAKKKLKHSFDAISPFFVNIDGSRIRGESLYDTFVRLAKRVGISDGSKRPVLHDLRHNFATQALKRFYSDDRYPAQTFMNILAVYLGHSDMLYSQYYLHPDFDLLLKASERFADGRKAA